MLYLHPPFYSYEGVSVVPDNTDPQQFYYFPDRPHLAVDEQGRPAIRLIIYKENLDELPEGEEHAAGFLVFDTVLSWPQKLLDKVATKLQDALNLRDPPRLTPLLFKSGSVRLMFLDRMTEPPSPPGTPPATPAETPPSRWAPILETSGVPSLYGENRAIFSAVLTKRACSMMLAAFDGFIPAGVVYDLCYVGLQRAFNVRVKADWRQVYHHLSSKFTLNLIFFSATIQKAVDELVENKIIQFESTLEGIGEEGMEAEFNQVRKELQVFVLEKFFKPAVNPNQVNLPGRSEDGVQTAERIHDMLLHWPNVGYSRLELDVTTIETLDIDFTAAKAVERRIAPQAHISMFREDYDLHRNNVVTVVSGKDAMWEEVPFELGVNADFDGDGIYAVTADVYYGAPTENPAELPASWSFRFDKNNTVARRRAWYNPEVGRRFRYRYTVYLSSTATPGPSSILSSGWREEEGSLVIISPAELYEKRQIEAQVVKDFPFDRYSQILLDIRYQDPASGWTYEESKVLHKDGARVLVKLRTPKGAPQGAEYRCTFLGGSGDRQQSPWRSTASELIIIDDPSPDRLKVRLLVAGDRSKISNLVVDLRYDDPENGVHEEGSFILDPTNLAAVQVWSVPIKDPSRRRYAYSQTLLDTSGNLSQTGWIEDDRSTLPVGEVYARRWEIRPELIGPPLADSGVERIKLRLHYAHAASGYTDEKEELFAAPGKGESWLLQLRDPAARDYTYEVIYVLSSGFERRIGPIPARSTFLEISSIPPSS